MPLHEEIAFSNRDCCLLLLTVRALSLVCSKIYKLEPIVKASSRYSAAAVVSMVCFHSEGQTIILEEPKMHVDCQ